jgi:hypothetical protein
MDTPYRTLDNVVDGLAALEARFREEGDRRAIFLTLYGVVSTEMRDRIESRSFEDNDWVRRYAIAFGNLYRRALEAYDASDLQRVPKAWRLCFDAASVGRGLVLSDMFLGVNAHVNHDLPFALNGISIDPDRQKRYRDHAAVNEALGSVVERATQRIASLYAPGIAGLDRAAGEIDEMISAFSLEVARESAWESAISLANARDDDERRRVMKGIGLRAALVARLLRAPSVNPPLLAVCQRVEQENGWVAVLGNCS